MIAQEHAPSYQQQHNPTGSQALHPCPAAVLQTRAPPLGQRMGEMGMAGEAGAAACVAGTAGAVGAAVEAGVLNDVLQ